MDFTLPPPHIHGTPFLFRHPGALEQKDAILFTSSFRFAHFSSFARSHTCPYIPYARRFIIYVFAWCKSSRQPRLPFILSPPFFYRRWSGRSCSCLERQLPYNGVHSCSSPRCTSPASISIGPLLNSLSLFLAHVNPTTYRWTTDTSNRSLPVLFHNTLPHHALSSHIAHQKVFPIGMIASCLLLAHDTIPGRMIYQLRVAVL